MAQSTHLKRLDCLLILRVVATIAVVLGHAAAFYGGLSFTQWPGFPYIQNIAVVLFFCLSGWTIAWLIDSRREDGFGKYLFDRTLRLAIPLVPVLLIFAMVEAIYYGGAGPFGGNTSRQFIGNMLFLTNLKFHIPFLGVAYDPGIIPFGSNRPLWTLALEYWIYVAYGAFAMALRGAPRTWLLALVGMVAISLLEPSIYGSRGSGLPLVWMAGALLYHAQKGTGALPGVARIALLPIWVYTAWVLLDPSIWPANGEYSATYSAAIFANFALFMMVVPGLRIPASTMTLAGFLGRFAYTVYLVHYPIMQIARDTGLVPRGTVTVIIMTALSFACAWLISLPFEQRYQQIRNWIWSLAFKRRHATAQ